MKKVIRPLAVAILSSSTIYDGSNNRNVALGFVTSPVYPTRTVDTHNHCITNTNTNPSFGSRLNYAPGSDQDFGPEIAKLTESFTSPVLKNNCGELLTWMGRYGHPNIPLKNDGGNACQVLRRLHVQQKLTDVEVEWLEDIGFRFHSIEDVYRFADFDEMLARLLAYEEARPDNNFQVPKKCPEDPELGAWVTGIRRFGSDGVNPDHERRLCEIGFAWQSTRKCGSKFMMRFRDYTKQVEAEGSDTVLEDPETIPWIKAQQQALKKGTLSQTRVEYMGQLFGDTWTTIGKETNNNTNNIER